MQLAPLAVEHPLKALAGADRPVDRAARDAEHSLDLVHQIERVVPVSVHLVDERDDGDLAHAADFEKLDGLRLDALAAVDEHHRAVGRGEGAVGVLAEVVVTGRVEQVHVPDRGSELQHAGRDRDPALASPSPSSRWSSLARAAVA